MQPLLQVRIVHFKFINLGIIIILFNDYFRFINKANPNLYFDRSVHDVKFLRWLLDL